jgi:hypothetical protein
MKKCQQLNSKKRSKRSRHKKRNRVSPPPCHQESRSKHLVVFLWPRIQEAMRNESLRASINEILQPIGRSFSPEQWDAEKHGAIVAVHRRLAKVTIERLSRLEDLALMIVEDRRAGVQITTIRMDEDGETL